MPYQKYPWKEDGSRWVNNSFSPVKADLSDNPFEGFSYAVIALGFSILIHSFFINKFKLSIVRVPTDLACIATICQSLCLLQCVTSCTPIESVVYVNILANAFFSAIVQGILYINVNIFVTTPYVIFTHVIHICIYP